MSSHGRITLLTIARAAGVSLMTVSMALRNHPRISGATRQRIQQLAADMGYQPDPVLSRLMAHLRNTARKVRPPTVAFLVSCADWRSGFQNSMFEGARQRALARGYRMDVLDLNEKGMSLRRMNEILKHRGIEGVLIAPVRRGGGHLRLDFSRLAVANLGSNIWRPSLHGTHHDYFHGTMLMLRNLLRHGYRNIGMVTTRSLTLTTDHQEEAAFWYYAARLRRKPPPILFLAEWDAAAFLEWFRRHRPDAVATCYPEAVKTLRAAGYPVPGSVGVALNWIPEGSSCAGVWQDFEGAGAAAFDMVERQIRLHECGIPAQPLTVLVRGRWVEGDTLRPLAPRSAPPRVS